MNGRPRCAEPNCQVICYGEPLPGFLGSGFLPRPQRVTSTLTKRHDSVKVFHAPVPDSPGVSCGPYSATSLEFFEEHACSKQGPVSPVCAEFTDEDDCRIRATLSKQTAHRVANQMDRPCLRFSNRDLGCAASHAKPKVAWLRTTCRGSDDHLIGQQVEG